MTRPLLLTAAALLLTACGQPPPEKAIRGSWVQDVPTSTTEDGLNIITSDSVLRLETDGDASLQRLLTLRGRGLPVDGVVLDVSLSGAWVLRDGALVQTLESASITPRTDTDMAREIASNLQAQAATSETSTKAIIVLDRDRLILQDAETGATDTYVRK